MRQPTECQRLVLEDSSRIRVVEAAPGSGKTWLIAEAIRREHHAWTQSHRGIAALSFTNVAGEEIRRAVGATLDHPHFVGTIDAFVYRYIVRPFACWFQAAMKPPRLVPADLERTLTDQQQWANRLKYVVQRQPKPIRENLFRFHLAAGSANGAALVKVKPQWTTLHLTEEESKLVLRAKKKVWRKTGRISHSDCAYIAASMLCDDSKGKSLLDLLAHRFPFIVVDELQDTGYFLSRALLRLMEHPHVRALVVGDPDQAIYGFNGARPEVFGEFKKLPGASDFSMTVSERCSAAVCRTATALSVTKRTIVPSWSASAGRSLLLMHEDDPSPVLALAGQIRLATPLAEGKVAFLARGRREVQQLLGYGKDEVPPFKSKPISYLYQAVRHMQLGAMAAALTSAQAALGRCLLKNDAPTEDDLLRVGIAPAEWRMAAAELIWRAREVPTPAESAYDWGCRMRSEIERIVHDTGWWNRCSGRTPKQPDAATRSVEMSGLLRKREHSVAGVRVQTVHAVKGETHHTTLYYLAKPAKADRCPSRTWWSRDSDLAEERRVAFVAATRPRVTFILALHRSTYHQIQTRHPGFFAAFEVFEEVPAQASVLGLASSTLSVGPLRIARPIVPAWDDGALPER